MTVPCPVEPTLDGTARVRDGVRIRFSVHRGATRSRRVALVHSLALDRGIWAYVVPHLVEHADVVTYDCRGHGESGAGAYDYSMPQFADDLADLLDALGWPDALVAGASMGGAVAQQFAASHADRTVGGVFVDTTAWYGEGAPGTWRARSATARETGFASMLDFQFSRWFGDDFGRQHPDAVDALRETFLANDVDAYEATCAMMGDYDLRSLAPHITAPAAVLVGGDDYATPPEMAKALAASVDAAPPTVLDGAKHLTPLERPAEIAAGILETLERADGAARA
ncbi:MAG: alpha/beta fold hydrolase [Streptosporangiales bacterium]|nr:alpha/beta fold hydrolase [Streptosporangiales bacterium]